MLESRKKRKASKVDAKGSAESAMTVGRYLKTERESQGQDLPQVAEMLRIHRSYLQAIEEGEVEKLPGPTYAVGFVRAYAEHLGLDGNTVAERFKEEGKVPEQRAQLVFPSPMPEGQIPSLAVLLIAAVLLLVAYGGWVFVSSPDGGIAEMVPALSDRFAALVDDDDRKDDTVKRTASSVAPAEKETEPEAAQSTTGESMPSPTVSVEKEVVTPKPETEAETPESSAEAVSEAPSVQAEKQATASETASTSDDASKTSEANSEAISDRNEESAASTTRDDSQPEGAAEAASEGESSQKKSQVAGTDREAPKELPEPRETESVANPTSDGNGEAPPAATAVAEAKPTVENSDLDGLNAAASTVVASATPEETQVKTEEVAAAAGIQQDEEDGPRIYGEAGDTSRITIRAIVDSWVEVRDDEGELLLTRVLREGDQYHVPDRSGLTLVTGNAGGLEFAVDGEKVPEIGPLGTVRRNVRLEPQALKDGTASTR